MTIALLREQEVVHVNTGIGIDATREFVRETCAAQGWTLTEFHPPVPYDEIVVEHGWTGLPPSQIDGRTSL